MERLGFAGCCAAFFSINTCCYATGNTCIRKCLSNIDYSRIQNKKGPEDAGGVDESFQDNG